MRRGQSRKNSNLESLLSVASCQSPWPGPRGSSVALCTVTLGAVERWCPVNKVIGGVVGGPSTNDPAACSNESPMFCCHIHTGVEYPIRWYGRTFMEGVAFTSISHGCREASTRKSRPKYWNVCLQCQPTTIEQFVLPQYGNHLSHHQSARGAGRAAGGTQAAGASVIAGFVSVLGIWCAPGGVR
jgi:hypothetical protein